MISDNTKENKNISIKDSVDFWEGLEDNLQDFLNEFYERRERVKKGERVDKSLLTKCRETEITRNFEKEGFREEFIKFEDIKKSFLDERGRLRLYKIRGVYSNPSISEIPTIIDSFVYWMNQVEYVVIQAQIDKFNGEVEKKNMGVICAKRGDKKYRYKLKEKFSNLPALIEQNCIYVKKVDITTDIKKYDNIRDSWENIGIRFNRLNSYLKHKYKKNFIGFIRTWESFKNSYPHAHAICFFRKYVHINQKQLEKTCGSFVKFRNIKNKKDKKKQIGYVMKYLIKSFDEYNDEDYNKHVQTIALLWLFKKQSYGISKAISDLIKHKSNSNGFGYQVTLFGDFIEVNYVFIGVFLASEIGVKGDKWVVLLDRPPTPPPPTYDFMKY